MKKIRLLLISAIVSLLLISYVSASWLNSYDYYNDNNYKTLYDYMQSQKEAYDNNQKYYAYNQKKAKSEYYQIDVKSWLYKNDDAYIRDYDNDKKDLDYNYKYRDHDYRSSDYNSKNYDKNQYEKDDVIVYIKPNQDKTKKKVIYKKQIKQVMCDFYKCYIEYQEYYE